MSLHCTGPSEQDSDPGAAPTPSPSPQAIGSSVSPRRVDEENNDNDRGRWEGAGGARLPHGVPKVCAGILTNALVCGEAELTGSAVKVFGLPDLLSKLRLYIWWSFPQAVIPTIEYDYTQQLAITSA